MNCLLDKIGNQLKIERNKRNITQEELANNSGLHRTYIGDIENGKRNISIKTIEKIIRALSMEISEFFLLIENNKEES